MYQMRVGWRVTSAPALTREQIADGILDRLQGYTRRQGVAVHDRAYILSVLNQWDREVKELEGYLRTLRAALEAPKSPKRRWMSYLGFLIGYYECPSL